MSIDSFKKITELLDSEPLVGSEYMVVANNTSTTKITSNGVLTFIKDNLNLQPDEIAGAGTTGIDLIQTNTPAEARGVLELGELAVQNTVTIGQVDSLSTALSNINQDIADLDADTLKKADDLSDVANTAQARLNLELGPSNAVTFGNITANGTLTTYAGISANGTIVANGSISANGALASTFSNTTSGGIINLSIPSSGSTISSGLRMDVSGDLLRFYEVGGSSRGIYVDLTTAAGSIGSNLWHSGNFNPTTKANIEGTSILVPSGNTSNRPVSPTSFNFRFNTQLNVYEGYHGLTLSWQSISTEAYARRQSILMAIALG